MLLLDRNTPAPPAGAAIFSDTVPSEELPPATEVGLSDSPETERVAAVPHIPGVPPPPQVWPKSHPHEMVPPQPSAMLPHVPCGTSKHVLGAQPAVTVRALVIAVCPAAPEFAAIVTVVSARLISRPV